MDVCCVTGEQDAPDAVGGGLPRHVSEAGDRSWIVDPVVGTPDGDERLTQIAQGGLTRVFNVPFGYQHAHEPWLLQLAEGVAAKGVVVDAPFRSLASWTSAIRVLVVGSHPGKSMPAT